MSPAALPLYPGMWRAIYGAIGTLHLEYQLGNVPERQYREQLANYRLQAALALWEQDRRRMESEALEAEILTARSSLVSDPAPAGHDDAQDAGAGEGTSLPVDSAPAAAPRGVGQEKWATADRPGGNSRAGSDTGSRAHTRQSPAKRWLWSICLLPVLLCGPGGVHLYNFATGAQESATLKGMLINGTAGSPLPSGVAVSLHALGRPGV